MFSNPVFFEVFRPRVDRAAVLACELAAPTAARLWHVVSWIRQHVMPRNPVIGQVVASGEEGAALRTAKLTARTALHPLQFSRLLVFASLASLSRLGFRDGLPPGKS